jgi:hypothetical protein
MQPFSIKTIFIILIAGVTFFAASLVPAPIDEFIPTVLNILFRSLVITILFICLTYAFQVSEDANNLARLGLEKVKGFMKKAA